MKDNFKFSELALTSAFWITRAELRLGLQLGASKEGGNCVCGRIGPGVVLKLEMASGR